MDNTENKEVQVLMKNNVITKAKFNITTVENRIFQLVMYKLQKKGAGVLSCEISLEEFKAVIRNKNQVNSEAISEVLVALRKQSIYFKKTKVEQLAEKKDKKPFQIWGEWGIINGHEYDEETRVFTIEASEKVHLLLHDYLEGGYTPINLGVFFSLSNSYAQRFYDLLRLWTNSKKIITYTFDELKELLMLEDKYSRYVDFKRRVITPALEELNKTGMFEIEIKEHRKGRSIDSIDFIVNDLDKRKYFENTVITPPVTEEPSDPSDEAVVDVDCADSEENKKEVAGETRLPEETVLIKPLHRLVKLAFKGIDFSQGEYYMAFVEAEVATQIQDNVEEIGMKEWGYFKTVLENKCNEISKKGENKDRISKLEDGLLGWK